MSLILDRGAGNYEVTDVMLEHNHLLHLPETRRRPHADLFVPMKAKMKMKMKKLTFYPILVLVCMVMRTRQNFKKHLTL